MNYYSILSVPMTASAEEIEKAYKQAIKIYHPDNYNAYKGLKEDFTEKIKSINEAYDVLMDKEKRKRYDKETKQMINFTNEYNKIEKISQEHSLEEYKSIRENLKQRVDEWGENYG